MRDQKKNSIKIFGLIIERKTNFVAISAFLLSFITLGWTSMWYVIGYLRGPEIDFIIPDKVALFANFCEGKKDIQFIEIIAAVAYSNTGWIGHNDVLLDEKMHIKLGGKNIQLTANNIVKTHDNDVPSDGFVCNEQEQGVYPKITIESIGSANVTVLNAGSALAREVHYVVDDKSCDPEWSGCVRQNGGLTYDQFIKMVKHEKIEIEFHVNFLKDGYKRARCGITFDQKMLTHFTSKYNLSTSCIP